MKKKSAPIPDPIVPNDPPAWLSETASSVWTRTASDLARDGIYDSTFDDLLATYCWAMASVVDASSRGDPPQAALLAQVRQLAIAIGVDPAARREMIFHRSRTF